MAENQEQKPKLTLQDIVNYTTISTAAETNNPNYINYAFSDYLESKSDTEKRELEPWINALRSDINANIQTNRERSARGEIKPADITKNVIPEWANNPLNNYERLYEETLNQSKISNLIDVAKKIGYDPADFSNLVNPNENYADLTKAYKELTKKIQLAQIEEKQPEITEEDQKLQNKLQAISTLQEMTKKTIVYSYDKRYSNGSLDGLNEKYKTKEQKEQSQEQLPKAT